MSASPPDPALPPLRHGFAASNGLRLHYVEAGEGPPILLLHGFPEFWYGWRSVLPRLTAEGFRAVAADLRGYNESSRPAGVEAYRMEHLVADAASLLEHLSDEPGVLVGHDWGGVIAWHTAMARPELVRKLVILNAPHPAAYRREVRRGAGQLLRSSYAALFQLPRLPEALIGMRDFALLRSALHHGPASTEAEVDRYVEAMASPGALTAALNYYRALRRPPFARVRTITIPVLVLWGDRDRYLVRELAEGLEEWVPGVRVEHFPEATHWLHHEHPERIASSIAEFARD